MLIAVSGLCVLSFNAGFVMIGRLSPLKTKMKKKILGISAFYHDSAAALVIDGQIIAAAPGRRFTRKSTPRIFLFMLPNIA